jgi:formylmethanofuran dehydrogenase subunit E
MSEAWGAQWYWSRRLPELLAKNRKEEVRCHICGKTLLLEKAIVREAEILCDQCYDEKYPSKKNEGGS